MNTCECMSLKLVQGDQYAIPVDINFTTDNKTSTITPDNVDGVRVQVDKFLATWPNGTLLYNDGEWLFPLTQEMSLKMFGERNAQVQINIDGQIYSSGMKKVKIDTNIIKEKWDEV